MLAAGGALLSEGCHWQDFSSRSFCLMLLQHCSHRYAAAIRRAVPYLRQLGWKNFRVYRDLSDNDLSLKGLPEESQLREGACNVDALKEVRYLIHMAYIQPRSPCLGSLALQQPGRC